MNSNTKSYGLYDVKAYNNLIATNATVLSSFTFNGSTLATNKTIDSVNIIN
jgi:hypothetical protein